jgi:uncharacterized protein DUF3995
LHGSKRYVEVMGILSVLLAAILGLLAALHFSWAAGAHWGRGASVPELNHRPALRPGPLACAVVAILLIVAALLLLGRSGVLALPGPRWLTAAGTWAVGSVFVLRAIGDFQFFGLFRRVTGTKFASKDRFLYTPLCLLLAAGVFCVAWHPGGLGA